MVRLAHVWSSHFGAALGLPLMQPFVDRGWQVTVCCPDGPLVEHVRAAGIDHVPISIARRALAPGRDLVGIAQLARALRSGQFDIVHSHNIKVGWLARAVARLSTRSKVVHTVHGVALSDDAPRLARAFESGAERLAARICDRVLVQSNDDADALIAAGVSPRRLTFIGNGVDLSRFDPNAVDRTNARRQLGVGPDEILFVSAGRLVREKGFVDLALATRRARKTQPRIRTAIAGPRDPNSRQALTPSELAELELDVDLLGQRDDMPAVYAAADVVVLASRHEGLPRVLMEGAAMARPLLATAARGCREVVNDPLVGTLVPIADPDALASAMVDLARDRRRRVDQGAHNRTMARKRFDIQAVLGRLDRVYGDLLR